MNKNIFDKHFENLIKLFNSAKYNEVINYGLNLEEKDQIGFIYNFIGASFVNLQKYKKGIHYYNKSILVDNNYYEAFINLAEAYRIIKKYNKAISIAKKALEKNKDPIKAYFILANIYYDRNEIENSLIFYRKVLEIDHLHSLANNNIGIIYKNLRKYNKALEHYKVALSIDNKSPEIYNNIGLLFKEIGNKKIAIENFKKSLFLNKNFIDANFNMANVLKDIKKNVDSIKYYTKVLNLDPGHSQALSNKIFQLAHICDWENIKKFQNRIKFIGLKDKEIEPFTMLSFDDCPKRNQQRAELYVKNRFETSVGKNKIKLNFNKKNKIRLGYFSSKFYNHANMFLISRVLELHNKDKFELYGYSFGPDIKDEMYFKAKNIFKNFREVRNYSDDEVYNIVKKDEIDIAIDLVGYAEHNRANLFFKRAAPIQINYLGYPATMGSDKFDYIIADKIIIPQNHKKYYNEKVLYLPHTYQATNNKRKISNKKFTKTECDLPENSFVFCCFNNNYKITEIEFKIWMKLLKKVNNSVLWLIKSNDYVKKNIKKSARLCGIDPDRIIFARILENAEHLSRHSCADLFLDTFNYNAHTTCCDALYTGLPVLTKIGNSFPSRVSASLLYAINLPELVTKTNVEYEDLALDLALNSHKLKMVKEKLEKNIFSTNLFNTELYCQHYEQLLEGTQKK